MNWEIVIVIVLLIASAFFAASETALTAASRARMHSLANEGNKRASTVNHLREQMERVIGTLLLGNNFVNILASALATGAFVAIFGEAGVIYATAVMTVLVIVLGEVLPKTYAINNPDRVALSIAPAIRILTMILHPITRIVQIICNSILRLFGMKADTELGREESLMELRGAIDLHAGQVEDIQEAGRMLHSILDLDAVPVSDIMVHRSQVKMIDADIPADDIVRAVLSSPHTRIPLYREKPDNIVGILHAKDLLRAVQSNEWKLSGLEITALASEPWFIPESTSLLAQLKSFRDRHEHFAAVVDEYGAFLGIVTLEDILEEIVGDISDEHDLQVEGVKKNEDGTYDVDGIVTLRDLNREFGWRLPDEEASTLAGLVLHEARRIPDPGQIFVFYGFRFEILERQRNQVKLLRVLPPQMIEDDSEQEVA